MTPYTIAAPRRVERPSTPARADRMAIATRVERPPVPAPSVPPEASAQAGADLEALGDEIARLSAHMHAAEYRLLTLLRAFDEQEGWGAGGFRS